MPHVGILEILPPVNPKEDNIQRKVFYMNELLLLLLLHRVTYHLKIHVRREKL